MPNIIVCLLLPAQSCTKQPTEPLKVVRTLDFPQQKLGTVMCGNAELSALASLTFQGLIYLLLVGIPASEQHQTSILKKA